ncbi:MAG: TatD family hydrolase [Patescibacteria group bacterium]|jgi:TatD DNase family protein
MFIDTHAHVNFRAFREDADEVIKRALENDTWMILVGSEYRTSKRAIDYANKFEKGVYAAIGIHPIHLHPMEFSEEEEEMSATGEEFNFDMYEKLTTFEKVVAIGEIGLDYFHLPKTGDLEEVKEKQKKVFLEQVILGRTKNLPVIIHCRDAHDDMLAILKEFKRKNKELFPADGRPWGVMHCFYGSEDLAWQYFNLGLLVSFTGLITFNRQNDELLRKVPLHKFMVETDCPFMAPEPFRGKRNEPSLVKYVAARIAEAKGLTIDKIADVTTKNARELFNI